MTGTWLVQAAEEEQGPESPGHQGLAPGAGTGTPGRCLHQGTNGVGPTPSLYGWGDRGLGTGPASPRATVRVGHRAGTGCGSHLPWQSSAEPWRLLKQPCSGPSQLVTQGEVHVMQSAGRCAAPGAQALPRGQEVLLGT